MIAHVTDPPTGKQLPVAYAVIRGQLREGTQPLSVQQMHEADLIIAVKDGSFYVWKDRHGDHGVKVTFNKAWKMIEHAVRCHARRPKGKRTAPKEVLSGVDSFFYEV